MRNEISVFFKAKWQKIEFSRYDTNFSNRFWNEETIQIDDFNQIVSKEASLIRLRYSIRICIKIIGFAEQWNIENQVALGLWSRLKIPQISWNYGNVPSIFCRVHWFSLFSWKLLLAGGARSTFFVESKNTNK